MRKKKNKDTMTDIAIDGTMGLNVVGVMPSSGLAGETTLRSNYATGVGNVGKVLPTIGKIKGTTMVLKPIGKLKKSLGKFNMKGGIKI